MRRSKEDTQKTTDEIVETALSVFGEKGYSQTNLQDIADTLGITRAPIYYHFKNKLVLFEKTTADYLQKKRNAYAEIFESDKNIFEKVRLDLLQCSQRGPAEVTLFMGVDTLPELESVRKDREFTHQFIYDVKIKATKQALENNELVPGTDPIEFSNNCYALFHGVVGMSKDPLHNLSRDDILKLIDTLLQGMIIKYDNSRHTK